MRFILFLCVIFSFSLIATKNATNQDSVWINYLSQKDCKYANLQNPISMIRCDYGNISNYDRNFPQIPIRSKRFWDLDFNNNYIHDLNFLENTNEVINNLNGENNRFININPLSNLVSVGKTLNLSNNPLLDIDGLSNLKSVQSLYISNTGIKNVDGLRSLLFLSYNLHLNNNQLVDLDGLSNLYFVGGNINVSKNNLRDVDGLINLRKASILDLRNNYYLNDLIGLSNLSEIDYILIDNKMYDIWPPKGSAFCKNKLYEKLSLTGYSFIRHDYPIVISSKISCLR